MSKSKHFLDITDPTFVKDLKDSVVHVNEVVKHINAHIQDAHGIAGVTLEVMETKIRPDVRTRKAYVDSGDVMVIWFKDGIQKSAMLEFKQRKSYGFKTLADFKYEDVYVDSLYKLDRIRGRANTLGYILTDQYMTCIFSTCLNVFEKHMIVKEQYFRNRPCKWCSLPKEYFHEGMDQVCKMIVHLAAHYEEEDMQVIQDRKTQRQIKMAKSKIKTLEMQLKTQRELLVKLEKATPAVSPPPPPPPPPIKSTTPTCIREEAPFVRFKRLKK